MVFFFSSVYNLGVRKEGGTHMGKECIAFKEHDVVKAWNHMDYDVVADYGDYAYGHYLHCWDDGKRFLAKCRNCGGYILIQKSEYHGMRDDDYYTDYFPVEGAEDAETFNRRYDGFAMEQNFTERYIKKTNHHLSWSR